MIISLYYFFLLFQDIRTKEHKNADDVHLFVRTKASFRPHIHLFIMQNICSALHRILNEQKSSEYIYKTTVQCFR